MPQLLGRWVQPNLTRDVEAGGVGGFRKFGCSNTVPNDNIKLAEYLNLILTLGKCTY